MAGSIKAVRFSKINLEFLQVAKKKNSRFTEIYLDSNGERKRLITQTPYLEISSLNDTKTNSFGEMNTIFIGESTEKVKRFSDFTSSLQTKIIKQVSKIGDGWFEGKNVTFKTMIKTEESQQDYIRWPYMLNKNIFVDVKNNMIKFSDIKQGDLAKILFEISGLWFSNNQFGLVIIVHKIMIRDKMLKNVEDSYCYEFDTDSEDEMIPDDLVSVLVTEQKPSSKNKNTKRNSERFTKHKSSKEIDLSFNKKNTNTSKNFNDTTYDDIDFDAEL